MLYIYIYIYIYKPHLTSRFSPVTQVLSVTQFLSQVDPQLSFKIIIIGRY
jgi:hypothetical protein